jgi:hypothetical protein
MNEFIEAVKQFPALCGAPDPDRAAWILGAVFEEERTNPGSVFAENERDVVDPKNRLLYPFLWVRYAQNRAMAHYCLDLALMCVMNHEISTKSRNVWKDHATELFLSLKAQSFPEIDKIFPLEKVYESWWD